MRLVPLCSLLFCAPLFLAAMATPLRAQAPSPWSDLAVPGVAPGGVFNLGKMTHYLGNGQVHVYSAFTRSWSTLAVGPTATTQQTNDWLLIRDAGVWTAFAAMRGRFEPLPVSAGALLLNPVAQNNDSALFVRDNGSLYAFSGFVGHWSSRPISAGAAIAVQRHTGLLADGTLLSGYDSFTGQWHDQQVGSQATGLSCDGTAGTALVGTTVHGFSALRGSWNSAPGFANATVLRSDDWVVYRDSVQALAFSGLRGTFATAALGPVQSTQSQDLFGAFTTSAGALHLFSAVTGNWSVLGVSGNAVLRTTSAVALTMDGPQVTAWSAVRDTFAPLAVTSGGEDLAGTVAAVVPQGGGQPTLFSALTGAWHPAPADAINGLPRVTTTAALLPTTTGFRAFSPRTGAFVSLATTGGIAEGSTAVAPALVWDSNAFHFFDARRDVWLHEPRLSATAPVVTLWRTVAMLFDGSDAVGFGTQSGTVARITMPEPPVLWRANSEALGVATANHLLGFSALPLPTSLSQFPDFRRAFVTGATFRLYQQLPQGAAGFLAGGPAAATPLAVPGLGDVLLDPAFASVRFVLPQVDADRALLEIPVPDSPALRGAQFWFQSLIVPATGAPYLTDASVLWVN